MLGFFLNTSAGQATNYQATNYRPAANLIASPAASSGNSPDRLQIVTAGELGSPEALGLPVTPLLSRPGPNSNFIRRSSALLVVDSSQVDYER